MTTFGKMSLCRQNVVPFFFVPGRRRLLAGQGQLERFRLGVKLVVWCPVVLWSVAFRFIDDVDAVVGNRRDVQPVEVNRQLVVCCCCSCGALGWGSARARGVASRWGSDSAAAADPHVRRVPGVDLVPVGTRSWLSRTLRRRPDRSSSRIRCIVDPRIEAASPPIREESRLKRRWWRRGS